MERGVSACDHCADVSTHRLALALSLCLFAPAAGAQPARPPGPAAPEPEEVVAPDSPRASMARFLEHARAGRWPEAGRYLDAPRGSTAAVVARELVEVLDRHVWVDPGSLSGDAQGDTGDGLPTRVDEVARIPGPTGTPEPVRITRREFDDGVRWVFTRQTATRVTVWYGSLEGRWLRERLPAWSLRLGPKNLLRWQWAALPLILLASLAVARLLASLSVRALTKVTHRAWPDLDGRLTARALGPVTALWTAPLCGLAVDPLGLYPPAQRFVDGILRAWLFVSIFWALWRSVAVLAQGILGTQWSQAHPGSVTLIPLGAKAMKVVIVALAVTAVLSSLGYPVASLVAGLGIGGLALALAAQKTGEQLFGSVAIGLDQPFRVGEYVKVEDHEGTVESVGLRSTRIRTMKRTVVTIPNGKLADMRVENFSARDRFYFHCVLGLATDTPPETLRALLDAVRALLLAHPQRAEDDTPSAFVKDVSAEAVLVEVQAWFRAEDLTEFIPLRTELYLAVLAAVRAQGATLAAPVRVLRQG